MGTICILQKKHLTNYENCMININIFIRKHNNYVSSGFLGREYIGLQGLGMGDNLALLVTEKLLSPPATPASSFSVGSLIKRFAAKKAGVEDGGNQ